MEAQGHEHHAADHRQLDRRLGQRGTGPPVHDGPPAFLEHLPEDAAGRRGDDFADLTRRLARSQAWDGAENVNNSYGYFFDDLDCAKMGRSTPGKASRSRRSRASSGRQLGSPRRASWPGEKQPELRPSISYHWQPQPVILVSHDGRSTRSRRACSSRVPREISGAGSPARSTTTSSSWRDGIWKSWDTTIDEHYFTSSLARSWSGRFHATRTRRRPRRARTSPGSRPTSCSPT